MKLLAFLCLSGAAASPATHALGARLHDTVIASEHASAPFFVAAPDGDAPTMSLRSLLEPFAGHFRPPFAKTTKGFDGEPADDAGADLTVDELIEMLSLTRADEHLGAFSLGTEEPMSIMLRLEALASARAAPPFRELIAPFLPLDTTGANAVTAHVYLSSEGAAALANHTDVTDIVIVQLLGRKGWLYCPERPADPSKSPFPFVPSGIEVKLPKCATYTASEMASLACECVSARPPSLPVARSLARRGRRAAHPPAHDARARRLICSTCRNLWRRYVVTSPGDMFYLPRRTVHSARAVDGYSAHLTLGLKRGGCDACARRALPRRLEPTPMPVTPGTTFSVLDGADDGARSLNELDLSYSYSLTPTTAPSAEVCTSAPSFAQQSCATMGGVCYSVAATCGAVGGTFYAEGCGVDGCGCCTNRTNAPSPAPTTTPSPAPTTTTPTTAPTNAPSPAPTPTPTFCHVTDFVYSSCDDNCDSCGNGCDSSCDECQGGGDCESGAPTLGCDDSCDDDCDSSCDEDCDEKACVCADVAAHAHEIRDAGVCECCYTPIDEETGLIDHDTPGVDVGLAIGIPCGLIVLGCLCYIRVMTRGEPEVITVRPGADRAGGTEMTRTSTEPADSSAIAVRFGTVIAVQNRNGVETV